MIKILQKLISLYGGDKGKKTAKKLEEIISEAKSKITPSGKEFWDEEDIFLITYPNSFWEKNVLPLKTLNKFIDMHLRGTFDAVHILPFFPYSSDKGFSVIDYYQVKPEFGSWQHIEAISKSYRLMADLVLNHVSVKHEWFQKFLAGEEKYWNYFIHFAKDEIPHEALKKVSRPRASPLLTSFSTKRGERWVWTTFSVENSTDQVDLNYKNPEVLQEIIRVLLFYLEKGVRIFRLDAIPYIWKEVGTNCKSLPQVHTIISILRGVLDQVCPAALIVTQSSVSFEENISYFGKSTPASQIVYNFSLPPLVLNAFYAQNNSHLNNLALKMNVPNERCSFFNVLALHDGIGINGAKGFLSDQELQHMFDRVQKNSGQLSYRTAPDGKKRVIEMNSTWWSALNTDEESFELQKRKFITSYAICMALKGIPALYYLSLFGQSNDLELYKKTKIKRDLNRTEYSLDAIQLQLAKSDSKEATIATELKELVAKRKTMRAFHPNAQQDVVNLDPRVFALVRGEGSERVLALHNISKDRVEVDYEGKKFALEPYDFDWVIC